MTPKSYNNGRKREKNDGNNEVSGIVLVIISSFILLCIIITPILGDISKAICNVVIGFFGYFSYPLFLATLILGIFLIQDRKITLPVKYIVGISVAAFFMLLILQLATSHSLLSQSYGGYLSNVYLTKKSAGGIFFGIFAYLFKMLLTEVGAYIVFSLAAVFSVMLTMDIFKRIFKQSSFGQKAHKPSAALPQSGQPEVKQFLKSGNVSPVQPVLDNSLYVGLIEKASKPINSESGSFNDLVPHKPVKTLSNFTSPDSTFKSYGDESNSDYKSDAHKILFSGKYDLFNQSNLAQTNLAYGNTINSAPQSFDETSEPIMETKDIVKKRPPKYVHDDSQRKDTRPKLEDLPMPAEKDFSHQIVGGEIINGDDLSIKLAEEKLKKENPAEAAKRQEEIRSYNGDLIRFKMGDFDKRKIIPTPIKSVEEDFSDKNVGKDSFYNPAPITNGDYFGAKTVDKVSPSDNFKNANIQSAFAYKNETPKVEEKAYNLLDEEEEDYDSTPETRFESLMREERKISTPPIQVQTPIINGESLTGSDFESITEEKTAPYKTDSFNIIDEIEDMSETSFTNPDDHTGYYDKEETIPSFEEKIASIENALSSKSEYVELAKKSNLVITDKQIKIDDFMASQQLPEVPKPKKKKFARYIAPPIDLLLNNSTDPDDYGGNTEKKAEILEATLESFKISAKVVGIVKGPAVTRYELEMPVGIPVKKIDSCAQDIAYNLASNGKIRIETPIPGKRAVGIEVPNEKIAIVALRDIISSKEFSNASSSLSLALGKDITGQNIVCNLEKMPHLLIAGSTGSGKSACLNSIVMSILFKSSPDEVRLILIDPKQVEFVIYRDMPHLLMKNIINDTVQAINAFKWAKEEMDRRYKLFSKYYHKNLTEFNSSEVVTNGSEQRLPNIVIIVDELSELMMSPNRKELEDKITSIAQKARASGIHLILATQRPSVDVITGTIKANLPSRIAFAVISNTDSRTILDQIGAESLLGRGDMLYSPIDYNEPKRVQGAYVTSEEVATIVGFVKEHNQCDYDEAIEQALTVKEEPEREEDIGDTEDVFDPIMPEVLRRVIESGQASTSMIQRRFQVGYARASRIIDQMEEHKFIGPLDGSKPREVYITRELYKEIFGEDV